MPLCLANRRGGDVWQARCLPALRDLLFPPFRERFGAFAGGGRGRSGGRRRGVGVGGLVCRVCGVGARGMDLLDGSAGMGRLELVWFRGLVGGDNLVMGFFPLLEHKVGTASGIVGLYGGLL